MLTYTYYIHILYHLLYRLRYENEYKYDRLPNNNKYLIESNNDG